MRGEEGKRIKVKGTQHRGEEYREEDNLGEHTIPLVHHPSYRLRLISFPTPLHPLPPGPLHYPLRGTEGGEGEPGGNGGWEVGMWGGR